MKKIIFLLSFIMIASCSNSGFKQTNGIILLKSVGINFTNVKKLDVGISVETGFFKFNGTTMLAYDDQMNGTVKIKGDLVERILPFTARFFYFLNVNERIYCFFQGAGGVQAKFSDDLDNWFDLNGGLPVLDNDGGLYVNTWNVAVAVDDNNLFHMLVECTPDPYAPAAVGMSYLTANLVGSTLDFNFTKKSVMDIQGGGNPELKFIPGVGLVSLHGQNMDPFNDNFWYLSVSTLPTGQTTWIQKKERLKIWADKIHVADPSILDNGSSLVLAFSYDQNSSYEMTINKTYEELFNL